MIYIRSKDGKALMPSERGGRIGYFLRHGKAHVVSRVPFTVQLDYESTTYTQEVSLGVDAGSKHIGVSAGSEKKELLAAQVELRNDVVNLLSTRREQRRTRRNRKTRYRKIRFDNRKKKDDWLISCFQSRRQQSRLPSSTFRKSRVPTSRVRSTSKVSRWGFGT